MWRLLLGTMEVKSLVQGFYAAATAGFEPRTVWSEVRRRNRLATAYDQLLPTSKSLKIMEIACKHHCTHTHRLAPRHVSVPRSRILSDCFFFFFFFFCACCDYPGTGYCKSRIFRRPTHSIFVSWALRPFVCMEFSYSRWPLRILWLAWYLSHAFYFRAGAAAYEINTKITCIRNILD